MLVFLHTLCVKYFDGASLNTFSDHIVKLVNSSFRGGRILRHHIHGRHTDHIIYIINVARYWGVERQRSFYHRCSWYSFGKMCLLWLWGSALSFSIGNILRAYRWAVMGTLVSRVLNISNELECRNSNLVEPIFNHNNPTHPEMEMVRRNTIPRCLWFAENYCRIFSLQAFNFHPLLTL